MFLFSWRMAVRGQYFTAFDWLSNLQCNNVHVKACFKTCMREMTFLETHTKQKPVLCPIPFNFKVRYFRIATLSSVERLCFCALWPYHSACIQDIPGLSQRIWKIQSLPSLTLARERDGASKWSICIIQISHLFCSSFYYSFMQFCLWTVVQCPTLQIVWVHPRAHLSF